MNSRSPHPLALALIEALDALPARVLELAPGSGRNTDALRRAGLDVETIPDASLDEWSRSGVPGGAFDAVLSTHGFLHGTTATAGALIERSSRALRGGGLFFATFASVRDGRFGRGTRLDDRSYAPEDGEEAGVAHVYFDERSLRRELRGRFEIQSLEERNVDDVVGRWAHAERPIGSVHWFVRARALSSAE